MRVALLGPVAWRTPPVHYGPWEQVTGLLADGLVARGVDVTLFATLDSVTTATLDGVCAHGYAEDAGMDGRVWEALHVAHAFARSDRFDLVHSHLDWLPLAFARACRAPLVTTVHGFSDPAILPAYQAAASAYVSISDSDRRAELDYVATVYHGIDLAGLPFSAAAGEDLVILGRIHPDKGTADAIEIARRSGRRLVIAGIVQDERYFAEQVRPHLDGDRGRDLGPIGTLERARRPGRRRDTAGIVPAERYFPEPGRPHLDGDRVRYLGPIGPVERAQVLGSAYALLHPIAFAEPFGLSVVESMACGTPVVAYDRGSMPEVVDEGVTGFLVGGVAEAVVAVGQVDGLGRARCRAVAARRFSAARMVDDYLAVYVHLLRGR